jgi:hypothetical protein
MYGLVVLVVSFVALFTRGWTKATLIVLIILWLPFLVFSFLVVAALYNLRTGGSILQLVATTAIVGAPIILILVVFLVVWKIMGRFRD